jgi:hypothetical protein
MRAFLFLDLAVERWMAGSSPAMTNLMKSKGKAADIGALARRHGRAAIKVLVAIMNQAEGPTAPRLSAAKVLLDRGWGRVGRGPASEDGGARALACIKRVIVFPGQHAQNSESQDEAGAQSATDSQD